VAGWLPAQQAEEKVKAAKGSNFGENKVIPRRCCGKFLNKILKCNVKVGIPK
jgi:hypothetical protein